LPSGAATWAVVVLLLAGAVYADASSGAVSGAIAHGGLATAADASFSRRTSARTVVARQLTGAFHADFVFCAFALAGARNRRHNTLAQRVGGGVANLSRRYVATLVAVVGVAVDALVVGGANHFPGAVLVLVALLGDAEAVNANGAGLNSAVRVGGAGDGGGAGAVQAYVIGIGAVRVGNARGYGRCNTLPQRVGGGVANLSRRYVATLVAVVGVANNALVVGGANHTCSTVCVIITGIQRQAFPDACARIQAYQAVGTFVFARNTDLPEEFIFSLLGGSGHTDTLSCGCCRRRLAHLPLRAGGTVAQRTALHGDSACTIATQETGCKQGHTQHCRTQTQINSPRPHCFFLKTHFLVPFEGNFSLENFSLFFEKLSASSHRIITYIYLQTFRYFNV
jgi:hypothetical protein